MLLGKVSSQLNRATELCEDGKCLEALKCYDEVLCAEPNNTDAIINKGVILQNLGHLNQAIRMYEKALIFEPENLDALINKGSTLHTMGKHAEAISCYNIVLRLDKKKSHGACIQRSFCSRNR